MGSYGKSNVPKKTSMVLRSQAATADGRNRSVSGSDDNAPRTFAIATSDHKAANKEELSFKVGDEIINIKGINENWWEGTHRRTLKTGRFFIDHVKFEPVANLRQFESEFGPVANLRPQLESEIRGKKAGQTFHSNGVTPPRGSTKKPDSPPAAQNNIVAGVIVVAAVAAVVAWFRPDLHLWGGSRNWKVNVALLKTQFKSQEPDMWDALQAGLMPSRTEGVQTFTFLHNSPRTAVCFLKKLSEDNCVVRNANDVSNSESFVSEMKESLLARKCLVMYDLEDLHPDGVAVLKGFCDAYEPIVPNTKFFFALNAGTEIVAEAKKTAKSLLESKWSKDFTHDEFGGTLTRLTQNVLKIGDEPDVSC